MKKIYAVFLINSLTPILKDYQNYEETTRRGAVPYLSVSPYLFQTKSGAEDFVAKRGNGKGFMFELLGGFVPPPSKWFDAE